ncbi:MG296/MPN423 family protein [Mycoplasma bradburyae]|uniref:MG296/MPN423 family protein n=1 Tax=Mycoplasma bradburyae TaxID=2963128 RepID=A0AAW6HRS3_9MOLU|nr:MG296/MPN423 family protein [Mycoplasma bradburyae]MDC4183040.1 MG296/MPN423 family protein [Mycoplasma bradburyae]UTS70722.1 MG296/MPN423 family protein [Mycoplasma bradburyae]
MQNLKTYIEKLKDLLSNIDLEKLINNYNKIMDKSMYTRIMYDDDEYAEIDFFEKQIEGEIEFIKTKLIQEVDEYIQDILKTKFSDKKKLALLHDHFYNLTQAIALTKNISFKRLNKLLNEEY